MEALDPDGIYRMDEYSVKRVIKHITFKKRMEGEEVEE